MDTKTGLAAVAAATDAIAKTDHDAAVVSATHSAKAEGLKEGATAERARCKAILGAKDSKGREEMAQHLAFETDMAADAAIALLGKSPAKADAPAKSASAPRLSVPQPSVDAGGPQDDQAHVQVGWEAALASVNGSKGTASLRR